MDFLLRVMPLNRFPTDQQTSGEAESSDCRTPAEHQVSCRSIMSSPANRPGRDAESGFGTTNGGGGHLRGRVEGDSGPPSSLLYRLVAGDGGGDGRNFPKHFAPVLG